MDKRGAVGHQIMAFSYLFILFMLALGIVLGVLIVYGENYDFKESDSSVLNYKIRDCILHNEIKEGFFNENVFYDACGLNKKALLDNKYMIKICNTEDCVESTSFKISLGSNFDSCLFEGAKENKLFPKCDISEIEKNSEKFFIVTGSNQEVVRNA